MRGFDISVSMLLVSGALGALIGCAVPSEDEPIAEAQQEIGIPIALVDLRYDNIAGGITPCWSVPAGIYTAASQRKAEFLLSFEASYASAGEPVTVGAGFFLSNLS